MFWGEEGQKFLFRAKGHIEKVMRIACNMLLPRTQERVQGGVGISDIVKGG